MVRDASVIALPLLPLLPLFPFLGVLPFFFFLGWSTLGTPADEPTNRLLGTNEQSPTEPMVEPSAPAIAGNFETFET